MLNQGGVMIFTGICGAIVLMAMGYYLYWWLVREPAHERSGLVVGGEGSVAIRAEFDPLLLPPFSLLPYRGCSLFLSYTDRRSQCQPRSFVNPARQRSRLPFLAPAMGVFEYVKTLFILQLLISFVFVVSGLIINFIQLCTCVLWPFNKQLYRRINCRLSYSLWSQLVMLLEWWSCTDCTLYTDQATVDKFGKEHIVFCKRKWEEDRDTVFRGLERLKDYPEYMWFLLYCEGTRFTEKKHQISMQDIPDDEKECADWLHKLYQEKDALQEHYEKEGRFPGPTIIPPRRPWTLLNFLFWATLLLSPLINFAWGVFISGSPLLIIGFFLFIIVASVAVRRLIGVTEVKKTGSSYGNQEAKKEN
ncbi:hypothetical protein JZ751_014023 [Albula glossodonta]|uniref:Acyltransferase C-terminal domain-containing protein n=1 Tax=Albula glossodonta TaxID=121402 RepID=A0A8T2MX50_9TELE|nr:hypothetical protein JZ751_014023 [Albula glossodonta]